MAAITSEYLILGGGLAGLNAAQVLGEAGKNVILIDHSLPQAKGALGGFTRFSGAKFSFLPAGQGLVPIAGGVAQLNRHIDHVLSFCELDGAGLKRSVDMDEHSLEGAAIREYDSIVLSPTEVEHLVQRVSAKVRRLVRVVDAKIVGLERTACGWVASDENGPVAEGMIMVAAGGRATGSLLNAAGVSPQEGKGFDLGVRLEFLDRGAVQMLRARGPDAKVLYENTRTFCLNFPGTIFRYPFQQISIPGGIVAHDDEPRANFGILTRVRGKSALLPQTLSNLKSLSTSDYEDPPTVRGVPDFQTPMIRSAYGHAVTHELTRFAETLGSLELVNWESEYKVHFPLLDWHWDVFACGETHRTDQPDLFVAGDVAGHARGLLQAAVSGRLAALEALDNAGV